MRLWLAWMCYCLGDTYRTGGVLLTNFSEIVHTSSEDKTKAKKIKKKNPIWGFCFFILLTLNFVSMLCCFFLAYSSLPPFLDWIIWVFVVAYCLSCLFIWLWKQWYYFYWAFHVLQSHLSRHVFSEWYSATSFYSYCICHYISSQFCFVGNWKTFK